MNSVKYNRMKECAMRQDWETSLLFFYNTESTKKEKKNEKINEFDACVDLNGKYADVWMW